MLSDSEILRNLPHVILVKNQLGEVVYTNSTSLDNCANNRAIKRQITGQDGKTYELCIYPSLEEKHYDNLTGLYTKGTFERELEHFYSTNEEEFCIVFADLDNFKLTNDTYGHLTADKILKLVANIIKKNVRTTDFASRFGGDEFVIVLKGISTELAKEKIDKIKEDISELNKSFNISKNQLQISSSFGISSSIGKDSAFDVMECADKALYKAKESKNSIAVDSGKIR